MSGTYIVNNDRLTGLTVYSTLPVGTVIATVGTSEVGFLAFDGSEYDGADYPTLYEKVKNLTAFQSETEGYFKLPNLAGRTIQQAESELGVLVEAGLPNITGTWGANGSTRNPIFDADAISGAISKDTSKKGQTFQGSAGGGSSASALLFDASQSNSIYKDDCDTVQPPAITLNFLIKATNYASLPQNAIDDTRVTNANAYSAEKIESKFTYSTTEKRIGTWVDGKPLYELSGVNTNLSSSSSYILASVLKNSYVDSVIELKGSCKLSDGIIRSIAGYVGGSNITRSQLGIDSTGLIFNCSNAETYSKVCWTIRYTKTTD